MATLGDLKARIISETVRDDLSDDLAAQFGNIIAKSISYYENERWWFSERRLITNTVPGQDYVAWPTLALGAPQEASWLDGLYLELNNGNTRWPLQARSNKEFEALARPGMTGQPSDYLVADSQVKLHPIPNAYWSLAWDIVAVVLPVLDYTDDSSSNRWMNEGQDLITAQAKIRLYRDYLSASASDPRLTLALAEEKDAYSNLRATSTRRTSTGRLQPSW